LQTTCSVYWPNHNDICDVSLTTILCTIDVPEQSGGSGQNYKLLPSTIDKINAKYRATTKV